MNLYKSALLGCCLGILAVLIVNLTTYTSLFLTLETLNKPSEFSRDKSSAAETLASSLWCSKRFDGTKLCKFKNFYFIPSFEGHIFFLINEFSVVSGVEDLKDLSLSTVQNHSGVYLKLIMIKSVEYFLHQNFSFLDTNMFIIKRFKSDNIMHVIHDDLLPLFVTYKELCSGNISLCLSTHRLLIFDSKDNGPYFEWYMHFSVHKPILIATEQNPLCIKKGLFGLSNSSIWFQYGFKNTQGPILNDHVNSFMLEEFTEFIRKQFGITTEVNSRKLSTTVFLSRKINRKILNERVMEEKMKQIVQSVHKTNIKSINLDLSSNNSDVIIYSLQRSQLLVGMHGSAMILAIFMHPGSHIIELFPFGIQPEFVSPLRALCKLQNIYYNYESWVNINELNTRTHPEYPSLLGGLSHLDDTKKEIVMNTKKVPPVECCHNPVYLFRMFQDTIVDDSFFNLFHTVVSNYIGLSRQEVIRKRQELVMFRWYFPPPVFQLSCKCFNGILKLEWNYPFKSEGIEFSVATSNGILAITKKTNLSVNAGECDIKVSDSSQPLIAVWVKTVDNKKESLDSFAQCITSEPRS